MRSIKEECLNRVIPFGERHLRRTIAEYVEHYHRERNHQGIENELIEGAPATSPRWPDSSASATRRVGHRALGMMHVYFGDSAMWEAPPIHVEIQPTGWLLDGGVPLWITMGAALAAGLRASYLVAVRANGSLQESGTAILCLQLTLLAICLSGPAFNTQLGIQFWALTAALWGPVLAAEAQLAAAEGRAAYA